MSNPQPTRTVANGPATPRPDRGLVIDVHDVDGEMLVTMTIVPMIVPVMEHLPPASVLLSRLILPARPREEILVDQATALGGGNDVVTTATNSPSRTVNAFELPNTSLNILVTVSGPFNGPRTTTTTTVKQSIRGVEIFTKATISTAPSNMGSSIMTWFNVTITTDQNATATSHNHYINTNSTRTNSNNSITFHRLNSNNSSHNSSHNSTNNYPNNSTNSANSAQVTHCDGKTDEYGQNLEPSLVGNPSCKRKSTSSEPSNPRRRLKEDLGSSEPSCSGTPTAAPLPYRPSTPFPHYTPPSQQSYIISQQRIIDFSRQHMTDDARIRILQQQERLEQNQGRRQQEYQQKQQEHQQKQQKQRQEERQDERNALSHNYDNVDYGADDSDSNSRVDDICSPTQGSHSGPMRSYSHSQDDELEISSRPDESSEQDSLIDRSPIASPSLPPLPLDEGDGVGDQAGEEEEDEDEEDEEEEEEEEDFSLSSCDLDSESEVLLPGWSEGGDGNDDGNGEGEGINGDGEYDLDGDGHGDSDKCGDGDLDNGHT